MLNIIKFSDLRGKKNINSLHDELNVKDGVYDIPVNDIKPNPNQPRKFLRRDELDLLTESVKKFGVCQPIKVRFINNKFYEIISGERRLMAAKAAGLEKIPAIILNISDSKGAVLSILENMYFQKLNFIEEAEGYNSLVEDYGYSEKEIASMFGMRDIEVSKKLRFMRFNAECRRIIVESGISKEHALIVLKIPDQQIQRSILRKISDSKLSLKKTEELVEYEIEKIKSDELIFSEQKEKRNFTDMRLLTNTVKRSVDLMKKSGVEAGYEVEQSGEETKIIISIPKMI